MNRNTKCRDPNRQHDLGKVTLSVAKGNVYAEYIRAGNAYFAPRHEFQSPRGDDAIGTVEEKNCINSFITAECLIRLQLQQHKLTYCSEVSCLGSYQYCWKIWFQSERNIFISRSPSPLKECKGQFKQTRSKVSMTEPQWRVHENPMKAAWHQWLIWKVNQFMWVSA